jgi:hypothetical protein
MNFTMIMAPFFFQSGKKQDVSDVLDAAYLPTTPAELVLFREKKKYVYAIIESKVETAKGKARM